MKHRPPLSFRVGSLPGLVVRQPFVIEVSHKWDEYSATTHMCDMWGFGRSAHSAVKMLVRAIPMNYCILKKMEQEGMPNDRFTLELMKMRAFLREPKE